MENGLEDYYTATVHLEINWRPDDRGIEGRGQSGRSASSQSRSVDRDRCKRRVTAREAALDTLLEGREKRGTHFVLVYPCGKDCMHPGWDFLESAPLPAWAGTHRISSLALLYPRSSVAEPDFDRIVLRYYHRCDVSIPEDNNIAECAAAGISESPL